MNLSEFGVGDVRGGTHFALQKSPRVVFQRTLPEAPTTVRREVILLLRLEVAPLAGRQQTLEDAHRAPRSRRTLSVTSELDVQDVTSRVGL